MNEIRRRRNWYIYLISFAATLLLLILVVFALWDVIFPGNVINNENDDPGGFLNYTPSKELDTTVLFMLRDTTAHPEKFVLLNYRAYDEKIIVVPLNAATTVTSGKTTGNLIDLYKHGGARTVMFGIENTLGVKCDYYVQFNRDSFIEFITLFGDVRINIPYQFTAGEMVLDDGIHELSGSELCTYLMQANFPEISEDYNSTAIGTAITSLLNNNVKDFTAETIQDAFDKILQGKTTNLTFKIYTVYRNALLHSAQSNFTNSIYYIPELEQNDKGETVIKKDSVAEIKKSFNLA